MCVFFRVDKIETLREISLENTNQIQQSFQNMINLITVIVQLTPVKLHLRTFRIRSVLSDAQSVRVQQFHLFRNRFDLSDG